MWGHRLSTAKIPSGVWNNAITWPSRLTVMRAPSGRPASDAARTKARFGDSAVRVFIDAFLLAVDD